jgi:outer membrane lipoprotein SlyB
MMIREIIALGLAGIILAGCARHEGQSQYSYSEVGQSTLVEFGTVVSSRDVGITGRNSGAGALVGAGVGAGAGSYVGSGSGRGWGVAGGAVAGAIAGAVAEQAAADRKGIEYTITKENGRTVTIVQEINPEDKVFQPGARVMVQTSGSYQRVLPTDTLPEQIKRPKGIKVVD